MVGIEHEVEYEVELEIGAAFVTVAEIVVGIAEQVYLAEEWFLCFVQIHPS